MASAPVHKVPYKDALALFHADVLELLDRLVPGQWLPENNLRPLLSKYGGLRALGCGSVYAALNKSGEFETMNNRSGLQFRKKLVAEDLATSSSSSSSAAPVKAAASGEDAEEVPCPKCRAPFRPSALARHAQQCRKPEEAAEAYVHRVLTTKSRRRLSSVEIAGAAESQGWPNWLNEVISLLSHDKRLSSSVHPTQGRLFFPATQQSVAEASSSSSTAESSSTLATFPPCPYCGQETRQSKLEAHVKKCPKKPAAKQDAQQQPKRKQQDDDLESFVDAYIEKIRKSKGKKLLAQQINKDARKSKRPHTWEEEVIRRLSSHELIRVTSTKHEGTVFTLAEQDSSSSDSDSNEPEIESQPSSSSTSDEQAASSVSTTSSSSAIDENQADVADAAAASSSTPTSTESAALEVSPAQSSTETEQQSQPISQAASSKSAAPSARPASSKTPLPSPASVAAAKKYAAVALTAKDQRVLERQIVQDTRKQRQRNMFEEVIRLLNADDRICLVEHKSLGKMYVPAEKPAAQ